MEGMSAPSVSARPSAVGLGMPQVPRVRRTREDVEAAAPVSGDKRVLLAAPRGYCAGVDRAVVAVEKALEHHGAPVYVRKEIVHNRHVVDTLTERGVVFVDELDEVPEGALTVFSAHGVSPAVVEEAAQRNLRTIDATCPLVTKVHREAAIHFKRGREILLIGHSHHPEVVGTLGQLPEGAVTLIETAEDAKTFVPKDPDNLAFVTQTTLSIDDTAEIVALLKQRFPNVNGPHKEDICYATTNRQLAVKKVAPVVDALIVVGAPNSSNSQRLREVAEREGCPVAILAQRASDIDWARFEGIKSLGITAGASAPEVIVEEIMGAFAERYQLHVETVSAAEENEFFPLPRSLRPDAAAAE